MPLLPEPQVRETEGCTEAWRGGQGLGHTGLRMPRRSQGLGLEMTGSLEKGHDQLGVSRRSFWALWGVSPLRQGRPALGWFILNGQGICSNQANFKGPSQLRYSVNHIYPQQPRVATPAQWGSLPSRPLGFITTLSPSSAETALFIFASPGTEHTFSKCSLDE